MVANEFNVVPSFLYSTDDGFDKKILLFYNINLHCINAYKIATQQLVIIIQGSLD